MELEGEITNFIKVWTSVVVSLCYSYFTAKFISKGLCRLLALTPVVILFFTLPLFLHSMHLGGTTAFFIAWLANFKLFLLAFNKGPLSDPSLSLSNFIAIGCFPIKTQQNENPPTKTSKKGRQSVWNYALKGFLVACFVQVYEYSEYIHPKGILVIYGFHIYFMLEITLATVATLARAMLCLELEPQFNEPYLATSLQDFWGRRWNLMVTRTLRPTVYDPSLRIWAPILGRKWAPLLAVMTSFVVSGLMHELIFYYLGRTWPTWEITWFFLLHGVCLVTEITIKKALTGRCRLPPVISMPLTMGIVMVTGFWLFYPQLLRCRADVRGLEEYAMVGAFVRETVGGALKFRDLNAHENIVAI